MGAVARSLQMAGALESMLDISLRYSNERVAFEKKISKFQAVQHNLARLAGESAAALAAATSAADTIAKQHLVRRRGLSGSRVRENPLRGSRRKGCGDRPSGARRDRLHHRAHPASLLLCARRPGATISAPRATGRSNSARWSPPAAPTNYGRWWRRGELHEIRLHESTRLENDRSPSFRSDPPAARMREVAQGSARLSRRGNRGRHLRSAQAPARGQRRAGILPPGRRARLARHDLAEEIWRP